MVTNLNRYEADLKSLISRAERLMIAMQRSIDSKAVDAQLKKTLGEQAVSFIGSLPDFKEGYQSWYSEALAVIRQLLPDRLADFKSHYEKPKSARRELTAANYVIDDFYQGLQVTRGYDNVIVSPSAAVPRFSAQISILKACQARFKSSLFDIRQLVHADILDSELAGARELLKNNFLRPAGVVAGIVLERHLQEVVASHDVKVKTRPTLGDFIQVLKDAEVLGTPDWRRLQHLNELRVKCTHNKGSEPTAEDVDDLITGVDRTIKTLF